MKGNVISNKNKNEERISEIKKQKREDTQRMEGNVGSTVPPVQTKGLQRESRFSQDNLPDPPRKKGNAQFERVRENIFKSHVRSKDYTL